MGVSSELLQFGAIPYRTGQNMLIAGDNSKFRKCFVINDNYQIGLTNGLIKTIDINEQKGDKPTRQIGFQETDIVSMANWYDSAISGQLFR